MAKFKYHFNPVSLSYDRVTTSVRTWFWRVFTFFTATLAISVGYYAVFTYFFDSPKEQILTRGLRQMEFQYELLNKKLSLIEDVMKEIQERDDNIYRSIFESEPIPSSVRQAGFGGVNRYEHLLGYGNSRLMVETSTRVDKITKQLYVQSKSFDEVVELLKNKEDILASTPAIRPIRELKYVASGYGMRLHPIYKTMHFHQGMDFAAPIGTDVIATADGKVVETDYRNYNRGYGLMIRIDHGYGYTTLYGHLSDILVRRGEQVKRGQIIAKVGSTGQSTGPHLHYEVHKSGRVMNPMGYYFNDLTPAEYDQMLQMASTGKTFD
mgnify:CR=1 FL=1